MQPGYVTGVPRWNLGSSVKAPLRLLFRSMGKGGGKRVVAVFAPSPQSAHAAVLHIRKGAPDTPVYLYTATQPLPETIALCERVAVHHDGLRLLLVSQVQLWRHWVALSCGCWTGEPAPALLKLAPLLLPPFRTLFLNENGDFFAGSTATLWRHLASLWRRGTRLRRAKAHLYRTLRDGAIRVNDVIGANVVWAAASILRASGYPHRALFHRLHGNQPLDLPPMESCGSGIAVFEQSGPAWNGAALEHLARSTTARWILCTERVPNGEYSDLLGPFADERAFAVSIQSHYRRWNTTLLPMAPLAPLPSGIAAQVLAPVSHTILVDRQKLLALGIPRCGLAGAAWLILFWKAASSDWRSFSVGQPEPIAEQPDFPAVETEFFLRVLASKELRSLGPREPQLSRGNIAFQPLTRTPARLRSVRPRVLIVSPFLPYPLSHGGAVRIYNLCRSLSARVDFALIAVREKHDAVDYSHLGEIFDRVYAVDLDERPSTDPRLPRQVRHHQSASLRSLIGRVAAEWRPDLLQIEYTHMAAFRDGAPDIPAILVEHDLTFSLYRQLAEKNRRPEDWREYERWRHFECRWLRAFDSVWTVSEEDRQLALIDGCNPETTLTVPNGVDTGRFVARDEPTDAPEILYVGSFRHLPNLLGFELLCREIMPELWNLHPEAVLRCVAGPRHTDYWDGDAGLDSRIVMHGFVEDLRPLYARAAVVAVPLQVSAGTNIKVLEAMACAKAVVTTPTGCTGLGLTHNYDALIPADPRDFAEAMAEVLSNASLRRGLAANARRTAQRDFSWNRIAIDAYDSYQALIRARDESKVSGF